jgi:hypothetical protein
MNATIKYITALAIALTAPPILAQTADQGNDQLHLQDRQGQQYYGWQFMTPQEAAAFRARMGAARTAEERQQIRHEHHALMRERARQMGIDLPQEPRPWGMQRGMGRGEGMGPAGSMGGNMRR